MRRVGCAGQSTAEYAILIAIVIAAMVGMQTYMKRGLQAKYKDASDTLTQQVGEGDFALQQMEQYEPYYAKSNFKVTQHQDQTEAVKDGGAVERTDVVDNSKREIGGYQQQGTTLSQDDAWK